MQNSQPAAPVGGVDYPVTFGQFQNWFSTDEACLDYLARLRWPEGFICPKCGGTDFGGPALACGCARAAPDARR